MSYSKKTLKEMIPIYLNGSLSDEEITEFESGLQKYPDLQSEIDEFSDIKESYDSARRDVSVDSDALFARIQTNIRQATRQRTNVQHDGIWMQLRRFFHDLYHMPVLSWSLAGIQMAALILVVILIPRQPDYKTLTTTPANTGQVRFNVVFVQQATELRIRTLLQEIDAVIVDGPTAKGLYVVSLTPSDDLHDRIRKLKSSPIVRFADKALSQRQPTRPGPYLTIGELSSPAVFTVSAWLMNGSAPAPHAI